MHLVGIGIGAIGGKAAGTIGGKGSDREDRSAVADGSDQQPAVYRPLEVSAGQRASVVPFVFPCSHLLLYLLALFNSQDQLQACLFAHQLIVA